MRLLTFENRRNYTTVRKSQSRWASAWVIPYIVLVDTRQRMPREPLPRDRKPQTQARPAPDSSLWKDRVSDGFREAVAPAARHLRQL